VSDLEPEHLRRAIGDCSIGANLVVVDGTASTNDLVAQLAAAGTARWSSPGARPPAAAGADAAGGTTRIAASRSASSCCRRSRRAAHPSWCT
jgi:hypothetical protein